jgi:ribonuclease HII
VALGKLEQAKLKMILGIDFCFYFSDRKSMSLTIEEIKKKIEEIQSKDDPLFREWMKDERKGVQKLIQSWFKKQEKKQEEREQFQSLFFYEKKARKKGYSVIAGIDEVGRGPLAGPVVAAAVILSDDFYLPGLNDSKKLSKEKREKFYTYIQQHADIGIGIVDHKEIDQLNIYQATKKAMQLAVQSLPRTPEYLLIDAMTLPLPVSQEAIIKGDSKSASIAAASIVAKVERDRMMERFAKQFPYYGFDKNMGYGTKEHINGLKTYGPCEIHRLTFSPVKEIMESVKGEKIH